MTTNNLYDQLIELANMENITISESVTERDRESHHDEENNQFPSKMKFIRNQI